MSAGFEPAKHTHGDLNPTPLTARETHQKIIFDFLLDLLHINPPDNNILFSFGFALFLINLIFVQLIILIPTNYGPNGDRTRGLCVISTAL